MSIARKFAHQAEAVLLLAFHLVSGQSRRSGWFAHR
jgi:hypothetical protein